MKKGENPGKEKLKAPVADVSSVPESPFTKKPLPKHNQTPMSRIDILSTDAADASNAKKEPEPFLKRFFLWLSMLPLVAVGIDVTQAAHGTGAGTTISASDLPKPEKAKSDPTSGERSVKVKLTFGEKEHDETDISKKISEIQTHSFSHPPWGQRAWKSSAGSW